MARNNCRNGWLASLNARLTTAVPLSSGQQFEIIADIFNLPNLINSRWGRYFDTTVGPTVRMLTLKGWDAVNGRGIYQLRSEEHTSELQSQSNLVCRLLLEQKNTSCCSHPTH